MQPIRILFIHHYGTFSGSSRSLWELIRAFPAGSVQPCVLTPRGRVLDVLSGAGIPCVTSGSVALFDNTRYGYYRGLRWLILLRELWRIPATYRTLRRIQRSLPDFDIVHVNEIVMLLAIVAGARWFQRPTVVHVRAVQDQRGSWQTRLVTRVLERNAAAVVAIDETVKRSLPKDLKVPISVIHNGLALQTGDLGATLPCPPLVVGMVGNLIRLKGCREFVEAAAQCKAAGLPIRFVFVGAGREAPSWLARQLVRLGIGQHIEHELRETVIHRDLADVVSFQPFTTDLAAVYRSMHVICFPSHLDAPGRPILEAALFSVPCIAAISRPTADTFIEGETGLTVTPGSPEDIVRALRRLLDDPEERLRMGQNARRLALAEFDVKRNALAMLDLYRKLLGWSEMAVDPTRTPKESSLP
jgi:glycosyltransferase involved in cell wall biosynthesis